MVHATPPAPTPGVSEPFDDWPVGQLTTPIRYDSQVYTPNSISVNECQVYTVTLVCRVPTGS